MKIVKYTPTKISAAAFAALIAQIVNPATESVSMDEGYMSTVWLDGGIVIAEVVVNDMDENPTTFTQWARYEEDGSLELPEGLYTASETKLV